MPPRYASRAPRAWADAGNLARPNLPSPGTELTRGILLAARGSAPLLSDRTKERVMYLQPLLARVLLATVSILLLLAVLAAVR